MKWIVASFVLASTLTVWESRIQKSPAVWLSVGLANQNVKSLLSANGKLYAAGFGSGVSVSVDGGKNWTESAIGMENKNVFALLAHSKQLLAGTKDGVYAFNGNDLWMRMSGMPADAKAYCLTKTAKGAIAGSRNGVYGLDGSNTWQLTKLGNVEEPYVYSICQANERLYAGTQGQGLFQSVDNGHTWTDAGDGLPASQTIGALVFDGATLIAGMDGAGIYVLQGSKWVNKSSGLASSKVFHLLQAKGKLYAATLGGVHWWDAPAGTWKIISSEGLPEGVVINSLAFIGEKLFAATEMGIFALAQ